MHAWLALDRAHAHRTKKTSTVLRDAYMSTVLHMRPLNRLFIGSDEAIFFGPLFQLIIIEDIFRVEGAFDIAFDVLVIKDIFDLEVSFNPVKDPRCLLDLSAKGIFEAVVIIGAGVVSHSLSPFDVF
jgi:hypothetical protein